MEDLQDMAETFRVLGLCFDLSTLTAESQSIERYVIFDPHTASNKRRERETENRERTNALVRARRTRNSERVNLLRREYCAKNRDKIKLTMKRYRARIKAANEAK